MITVTHNGHSIECRDEKEAHAALRRLARLDAVRAVSGETARHRAEQNAYNIICAAMDSQISTGETKARKVVTG